MFLSYWWASFVAISCCECILYNIIFHSHEKKYPIIIFLPFFFNLFIFLLFVLYPKKVIALCCILYTIIIRHFMKRTINYYFYYTIVQICYWMLVLKITGVYFKEMSIHSMCIYTSLPDISNISRNSKFWK